MKNVQHSNTRHTGVLESIRHSTAIIIGLTLADKVLALAKEMFFAYRFGVNTDLDIFNIAYAFPGIVVMLLGQAVISTLVPLYISWSGSGSSKLQRALPTLGWTCLSFFLVITLVCYWLAPVIFSWMGFGFSDASHPLGSDLERMLVWLILLDGAGAVFSGVLNARKSFGVIYTAQLAINSSIILFLWLWRGLGVEGLAIGFLVGSAIKLFMLILATGRKHSPLSVPSTWDGPALREFASLTWPLIAGGLVVNANILVDQVMGTQLPEGSVSTLRYAYRINDLPVQLLVIAASRALFPYVSEQVVAKDSHGMRFVFWNSILFVVAVSLPVTAFVTIFSKDIVTILLLRGAFGLDAVDSTALTLQYYSFGMIFYAYLFLNGTFFTAMRLTKTLMVMGVVTMIMNIGFNWLFIKLIHGPEGIALSTTVTTGLTSLAFAFIIQRVLNVSSALPKFRPFATVLGLCILAAGLSWISRIGLSTLGIDPVWAFFPCAALFGAIYLGGLMRCRDEGLRWCVGMLIPHRFLPTFPSQTSR